MTAGFWRRSAVALAAAAVLAALPGPTAGADPGAFGRWPAPAVLGPGDAGTPVGFASTSPFALSAVGDPAVPALTASARLFLPTAADGPVPAVILLHGAGGVMASRSPTYAAQFARMGVAALVVDVFGPRRDIATGFARRVLSITEAMFLADAYGGLAFLDARPEIDGDRVALIGFSYGGMAAVLAAHEPVAAAFAPDGRRFAAHIGFYGPCLARFDDRRATGAPVLMLLAEFDEITDPDRCREIAGDLAAGGAASAEVVVMDGAYHQWDGPFAGPRRVGRNVAACRFRVDAERRVREERTGIAMIDPLSRQAILALCSDEDGYLLGRDDTVRARANTLMSDFLRPVLFAG